ncbi:MAG: putative outer membrane repeat protein [Arenicella sp.]|jgi:predicted outer membrane repeat protein
MPPLNNFTLSCLAIAISQAVAAPALATSIVVNDNGDPGTQDTCTLRQAIVSANTNDADAYPSNCTEGSNNATDTITFANSGPITLTRPLPSLNTNMAIIGNANGSTIDANGTGRVFHVRNAAVSFIDLTISGGSTSHRTDGPSARKGGGIYANDSTLSLSNSTVSGNSADDGGGIYTNYSTVNVSNSTISGNSAGNSGGAIYIGDYSTLSLSNSTVSSNSAAANGGAIYIPNSSYYYYYSANSLRKSNKTRSGNSAAASGYAEYYNSYITVSLNNNIISGNRAEAYNEIQGYGATFTTAHNLFGDSANYNSDAFSGFTPDATDITATSNGSQPTALSGILAPLADNGGATQTRALVAGSPAIDSGDDALCAAEPVNNLDQRGALRPIGNACDIGAYEGVGVASVAMGVLSMAKDDSSLFVVPLANGKVVVFEL